MSEIVTNRLKSGKSYKAIFTMGSGKDRLRKSKTFSELRSAKTWLHELELASDRGTTFDMARWTFLDYYKHWVEIYKKPFVTPNTLYTYTISYQHFQEFFAGVRLEDLTRNLIQKYFNQLDMSHETSRKDLIHIRSCLRDAVSDGVLMRNAATGSIRIIADPAKTKSDDKKFMAIADYRKVRDFLLDYNYDMNDVNRLALMIISQTALRVGECLALKYDDVDFLHGTVRVDESWDSKHQYLKEPKTEHAKRTLPLSAKALAILRQWIGYHRATLFKLGIANPQHFLLLNRRGRLPVAGNVNTSYHQLQIRLGITPKYSTHTLRHTLASMMITEKDISISYISRYLGHASTMITEKYYIGLLPEQETVGRQQVLAVINQ
ncbi:tyrosine-type recombinase/integrase [Levilactobacillus acidifarinae]|uniref:Prophage Lp2 protein 2, integrase n=1 Tax=Levilactobacillus acidifarinae DSM 19394 = JCM 15949 TaxID=1423715 RepID=A0A0R1LS99_9LACO|nr:tyrosine-type recombinase/integrase [Levilactobacillus acidifarinae]KRK95010.1 prophage Lp2 protein 2, integrase [Levilactobacillus acidifarinae DSM 19394]GEO70765.1 site-specific integrase [Levilactobacillus acidifarinae]